MSHSLRDPYLDTLTVNEHIYHYFSVPKVEQTPGALKKLPKSLVVLLENLLRHLDGDTVQLADIDAVVTWLNSGHAEREIAYRPARVLMQDFTGVPAVVDLAAMRDAAKIELPFSDYAGGLGWSDSR